MKTRLAKGVGVAAALRFYRSSTGALARRVDGGRRWTTCLAVAPDRALDSPAWPGHLSRCGQGGGDLGQRMQRLIDRLGPGPVVIVGSDIPGITPSHIDQAFQKLGGADIVLGPAPDGGYWLIGFKRFPKVPRILKNIRWSHQQTLSDTLRNAQGLRIAQLCPLEDVDEARDLADVADWSGRVVLPASTFTAGWR